MLLEKAVESRQLLHKFNLSLKEWLPVRQHTVNRLHQILDTYRISHRRANYAKGLGILALGIPSLIAGGVDITLANNALSQAQSSLEGEKNVSRKAEAAYMEVQAYCERVRGIIYEKYKEVIPDLPDATKLFALFLDCYRYSEEHIPRIIADVHRIDPQALNLVRTIESGNGFMYLFSLFLQVIVSAFDFRELYGRQNDTDKKLEDIASKLERQHGELISVVSYLSQKHSV